MEDMLAKGGRKERTKTSKKMGRSRSASTHPDFPFPQHRIRRRGPEGRIAPGLFHFIMTASMVYSTANPHGVHPDEILRLVIPRRLKLLLADGAGERDQNSIIGNRNIFILGIILGRCGRSLSLGSFCTVRCFVLTVFIVIPVFDPALWGGTLVETGK